jgi:hypothetical protein
MRVCLEYKQANLGTQIRLLGRPYTSNNETTIVFRVVQIPFTRYNNGILMFICCQINKATKDTELLQSAVKCHGHEYLRIIYVPEYMIEKNLERLKKRSLSKKRNLALSEFALCMESLERFARCEPLYRVHECVFGVLAMESEPIDPRL